LLLGQSLLYNFKMRSSILLASTLAIGALAKPLQKRVYETQVKVVETVTIEITVTAGHPAPSANAYGYNHGHHGKHTSKTDAVPSDSTTCTTSGLTTAHPVPTSKVPVPSYEPAPAPSYSSSSTHIVIPEPTYIPPPPSSTTTKAPQPTGNPSYGVTHKSGKVQATFQQGVDYQNAVLWHHNRARANHGASNLQWSSECEAGARKAASTCVFEHLTTSGQGQNLFASSGATNITAGITESFYKPEADAYQWYGSEPSMSNFHIWGHFSQMVWKETTHVGCVTINCPNMDASYYTVCNYSPPGNMAGSYGKNIGKPASSYNSYAWTD
jgi:uncharacterized protein YkwD